MYQQQMQPMNPMQQPMLAPPMAMIMADADPGRHPSCQPGKLLYSAKIDRDILACFYRVQFFCFPATVVQRTHLDIYSNGIHVNVPRGCCCCISCDDAKFIYFDNSFFTKPPIKGGCCTPCPYFCPHCFDFCGETLVFQSGICGLPIGLPKMFFHAGAACCICCPIDILCGLVAGEGATLQRTLDFALVNFRNGRRDIATASGAVVQKQVSASEGEAMML